MKRVFSILVALVLCISLFAGCGQDSSIVTADDEKLNSSIVATVDGMEISQAYYNLIYNMVYGQMSQYGMQMGDDWLNQDMGDGTTFADYIKETTQGTLEQSVAISVLAKEYGIEKSDISEDVKTQREELIEGYGGEEQYKEFLISSHTTDTALTAYIETSELCMKLIDEITKKGEEGYISDEEIKEGFLEEYKDKLRVKHVLISTQEQTDGAGETTPAKSDEEALKIAKDVIAKLDKGEDFDSLIDEYDEDPGMESGKFYVFGEGEMVAEFEQASKDLKVGEYTKEPVKTDYGYHIIKKYEINTEIEEFTTYKDSKIQEKGFEIITKKGEELKIKWDDKVIDAYLKTWEEERAAEAAAQQQTETSTQSTEATETEAVTETEAEEKTE